MTRSTRFYALRLAARELRGGLRHLSVLVACLILGVGAIAGIGSLAASLSAGIAGDARILLGGDAEARLANRQADAAERGFLEGGGKVSEIATLRAMARRADGTGHALVSLKAVDTAYPLYGRLILAPAGAPNGALDRRDGRYGAAVDPAVLDRLGLGLGAGIQIGAAVFRIRATIVREPDAAETGFILGPRVMISEAALTATGLLQPGVLVTYDYRLLLPPAADPMRWAAAARAAFPDAGWQIRTFAEAAPGLRRLIDRVALYLSLVGLTILIIGGVGIGNAVRFHVAGKTATIATLKSLGAANRLVFATFFAEVAAVAIAGIAAALALGALLPAAAAPLLAAVLPIAVRPGVHPQPLLLAAIYGLLATLVFSLPPLAAIGQVAPGLLFRDAVTREGRRTPLAVLGATALATLALGGTVVAATPRHDVALSFAAGVAVAMLVFRAAGAGIVFAGRQLPRPRRPMLRLALANLCRPGAPTEPVVLSLGLGLSVLVAVVLIQANLAREIDSRIPAEAPAVFFIDIQPSQLAGFEAIVGAIDGARVETVPMMRGRITRLNGVPVERTTVAPDARWALGSDRGLTYASLPPAGSHLAAGRWWPPGYRGPPLVSFDAALARGMGLTVGDTLSVNLLGREITARIANLRDIDWQRLGINFVIVFAPGTLERAPQTHLAAVYLRRGGEDRLVAKVTSAFPNISAIEVGEALASVGRVLAAIGGAVRLAAFAAVAAGALVLGGAVAAGQHRRIRDAVVLKVLGARRRMITGAYLIEHGLLGGLCGLVAGAVGTVAAYAAVTGLFATDWIFLPWLLLSTVAVATLSILVFGFAGSWRALGAVPAPYLRNE